MLVFKFVFLVFPCNSDKFLVDVNAYITLLCFRVGLGIIRKMLSSDRQPFHRTHWPFRFLVLTRKMAIYRISPTLSRKLRNIIHVRSSAHNMYLSDFKQKLNI